MHEDALLAVSFEYTLSALQEEALYVLSGNGRAPWHLGVHAPWVQGPPNRLAQGHAAAHIDCFDIPYTPDRFSCGRMSSACSSRFGTTSAEQQARLKNMSSQKGQGQVLQASPGTCCCVSADAELCLKDLMHTRKHTHRTCFSRSRSPTCQRGHHPGRTPRGDTSRHQPERTPPCACADLAYRKLHPHACTQVTSNAKRNPNIGHD